MEKYYFTKQELMHNTYLPDLYEHKIGCPKYVIIIKFKSY